MEVKLACHSLSSVTQLPNLLSVSELHAAFLVYEYQASWSNELNSVVAQALMQLWSFSFSLGIYGPSVRMSGRDGRKGFLYWSR